MAKTDRKESETAFDFVTTFNRAAPDFPLMFKGSLDKAISACWPKKVDNTRASPSSSKILALYVQKGFGEAFVEFLKSLSSRRMKMILMESFIIWGADIETPERQQAFVDLITEKIGEASVAIVSDLENEPYPKLYVLKKLQDDISLACKITSDESEDDIFLEIEAACRPIAKISDRMLSIDLREQRKTSSPLRESVAERIEKRASSISEQQKLRKNQIGRISSLGVPPEPPPDERGVIVFRFLDNSVGHERRFSEEDTVDGVVNYLITIGYTPERYRFMGRKSRTDIGRVDRGLRLKALQVGKQETITLELIKNKTDTY